MDDDEKEMLAEARARLANTRGKKAKRKAREKQLEEARRLAALQKGRELKAVGLCVGRWKRRNQMIDYAREVPFEKQPPKGFYAVGEDESPQVAKGVANFNLQELEGKRRVDEERRLRNEDTRRMKRLMEENLPEAIRAIERVNNPLPVRFIFILLVSSLHSFFSLERKPNCPCKSLSYPKMS
jgi:pre-mRNA-splicing factor CDC5/CEF1